MTSQAETRPRVLITPRAAALLKELKELYGPLLFHQSGGCCEGSAPFCFRENEFRIGDRDVLLDIVEGTPFYVDRFHYTYLCNERLVLDVLPSQGDSFSLESSLDLRFITNTVCPTK